MAGRIEERSTNICLAISSSIHAFHLHTANVFKMTYGGHDGYYQPLMPTALLVQPLENYLSRNWVLDTIRGNSERLWPDELGEFLEAIEGL